MPTAPVRPAQDLADWQQLQAQIELGARAPVTPTGNQRLQDAMAHQAAIVARLPPLLREIAEGRRIGMPTLRWHDPQERLAGLASRQQVSWRHDSIRGADQTPARAAAAPRAATRVTLRYHVEIDDQQSYHDVPTDLPMPRRAGTDAADDARGRLLCAAARRQCPDDLTILDIGDFDEDRRILDVWCRP